MKKFNEILTEVLATKENNKLSMPELVNIGSSLHDPQRIMPNERESLEHYSDKGFDKINKHLRGKEDLTTTPFLHQLVQSHVHHLDAAIKKHSTKIHAYVYRAIEPNAENNMFGEIPKPGKIYQDHGYVSTSLNRNYINGLNNVVRIALPRGSKALHLNTYDTTEFPEEHEVLLPRGSKFKYQKRERINDMVIHHLIHIPEKD